MKILILNWRDIKHPLAGGAEIATHKYAKRWIEAGHTVIQISSSEKRMKKTEVIDGVSIIRFGNHYTVHIRAFLYYLIYLRGKIDLIIDEFHFIPFFTPLYTRVKKIAFIHETAEYMWFKNQPYPINIFGFILEPFFFKLYRHLPFITVSESSKKDLIKFGIPKNNIVIIHNGVDYIDSTKTKEKEPTLIFLGRLAKDKGIVDAIQAFSFINKKYKNAKLWIVGREEKEGYTQELKNLAMKLEIVDQVKFFGFVDESEKFDLLKKAWILIHPSFKEGWGLTVIEAATQGTPTIAYNTGGLRDSVVDMKSGLLCAQGKIEDLSKLAMMIFKDRSLFNQLSKNAVIQSKKFNWDKATSESLVLVENQ